MNEWHIPIFQWTALTLCRKPPNKSWLVGGLEHEFYDFPFSWEFHHPNWRIHIFQRGRYTTNQMGTYGKTHGFRFSQGPLNQSITRLVPPWRWLMMQVLRLCALKDDHFWNQDGDPEKNAGWFQRYLVFRYMLSNVKHVMFFLDQDPNFFELFGFFGMGWNQKSEKTNRISC